MMAQGAPLRAPYSRFSGLPGLPLPSTFKKPPCAALSPQIENAGQLDFLRREVGEAFVERVNDMLAQFVACDALAQFVAHLENMLPER